MIKHGYMYVLISICLLFISFSGAFAQAPTGLSASPGNSQAVLTWNSVSGAASYNVYRGTSSGQETISAATGLSSPAYTDTGLTNNTVYYYIVKAVVSGVESTASNEAVVTPTASTTVIADTGADFSSTQGGKNWYYGYYNSSSDYTFNMSSMNYYTGDYGWHYQNASTFPVVWAHYQQPGNTLPTVRRWKSTITGTVTISGHVAKSDTRGGDGVVCKILCNGAVLQTYPLNYNDSTGTDFNFNVNGALNDNIDFAVFPNANNAYDSTQLIAQISAISRLKSPTNLTATAGTTQINLSWTGVTGASSYNVKRSTDNISYSVIATGVSGTSYTDTSVAANTPYSYYVAAVDNKGEGTASNIASATIAQTLTSIAISPLTATLALNQTQQFTAVGKDQFGASMTTQPPFTWSIDNGGVGTVDQTGLYNAGAAAGTATVRAASGSVSGTANVSVVSSLYSIILNPTSTTPTNTVNGTVTLNYAAPAGGASVIITSDTPAATPQSPITIPAGQTSASFTISTSATPMVPQASITATYLNNPLTAILTFNAPAAPSNLHGTAVSDSQINLTWDAASGASKYLVERSDDNGFTWTSVGEPTTASFTNTGLQPVTNYGYRITAVNGGGASSPTSAIYVTTKPKAPANATGSVGHNLVMLNWQAADAATGYTVYRGTASGGPYSTTVVSNTPNTYFLDTTVTDNTTYYYVVAASAFAGNSAYSNEVPAMPIDPAAVTGSTVTIGNVWMDDIQMNAITVKCNLTADAGGATRCTVNWTRSGGSSAAHSGSDNTWVDQFTYSSGVLYTYSVIEHLEWDSQVWDPNQQKYVTVTTTMDHNLGSINVTPMVVNAADCGTIDTRLDPRYSVVSYLNHKFGATLYKGGLFVGTSTDNAHVGRTILRFPLQTPPSNKAVWPASSICLYFLSATNPTTNGWPFVCRPVVDNGWTTADITWTTAPPFNPSGTPVWIGVTGAAAGWSRFKMSGANVAGYAANASALNAGLDVYDESYTGSWCYFARPDYDSAHQPALIYALGDK